jgi:hypothetical protein
MSQRHAAGGHHFMVTYGQQEYMLAAHNTLGAHEKP